MNTNVPSLDMSLQIYKNTFQHDTLWACRSDISGENMNNIMVEVVSTKQFYSNGSEAYSKTVLVLSSVVISDYKKNHRLIAFNFVLTFWNGYLLQNISL